MVKESDRLTDNLFPYALTDNLFKHYLLDRLGHLQLTDRSNDLSQNSTDVVQQVCKIRWKIEEFHARIKTINWY